MNSITKEVITGTLMTILFILLSLFILGSVSGCSSAPANHPLQAASVGIESSLAAAKSSQQQAAKQVANLKPNDPGWKSKADALENTIQDLGLAINEVTGKIHWYEAQYKQLFEDNTLTHKKLDSAIAYGKQEHIARIAAAKRGDVVIYAFALAIGIGFCRWANRAAVSPVTGLAGLVVPGIAFVVGFGAGYAFAFYVLNWLGKFLPDFSWIKA